MMGVTGDANGDHELLIPQVMCIVSSRLLLREVCSLLCVSKSCHRVLSSHAPLWKKLDLRGLSNAGARLGSAISLPRYASVEEINLEFGQEVRDDHIKVLGSKDLQQLNLNACQKITDVGVEAVGRSCPNLRSFSIYWNVKITDRGITRLVKCCKFLTALNLSGCKVVTDESLNCIARYCPGISSLNLTRCINLTDEGLIKVLDSCNNLEELYLYAISTFTDRAFRSFVKVPKIRVLDICGAQKCTDEGLAAIAECRNLISLNLTWCVRVSHVGVVALAAKRPALEYLSLHGILGVTDESLEALSRCCSHSLHTLDVHGCVNIKRRSREELLLLFPLLTTFAANS